MSSLTETVREIKVAYPTDWWQAVKERLAPRWVKRRWPVKLTEFKGYIAFAVLPHEVHLTRQERLV